MSRLKKIANHVSPQVHNAVTEQITRDNPIVPKSTFDDATKRLYSNYNFMIAKKLLADLPIVPTNERAYELTEQIQIGLYQDISPVEEAEQHWDAWLERTVVYLHSIGILIGSGNYDVSQYFKS